MLFIIYINDLPNAIAKPMVMFADAATILNSHSDKDMALKNSLDNLMAAENWCAEYQLSLNRNKTAIMMFSIRTKDSEGAKENKLSQSITS